MLYLLYVYNDMTMLVFETCEPFFVKKSAINQSTNWNRPVVVPDALPVVFNFARTTANGSMSPANGPDRAETDEQREDDGAWPSSEDDDDEDWKVRILNLGSQRNVWFYFLF